MAWVTALRWKEMKKQTSVKLFLIQWFFLVITAISGFLIYKMLFPLYYDHLKNTQIHNAYLDIAELDLNCLGSEEASCRERVCLYV